MVTVGRWILMWGMGMVMLRCEIISFSSIVRRDHLSNKKGKRWEREEREGEEKIGERVKIEVRIEIQLNTVKYR